ncbi:MAG: class I SAM-dependent methyltransferase [Armatimonadota bacterium]|nr:class I SAM-dependent methyltransferase [Armatimonadota bacterium]
MLYKVPDRFSPGGAEFSLVKCKECGLVYVNPRPTADVIGKYYPDEYYGLEVLHEGGLQQSLKYLERRRLSDIEKFVPRGCILDMGCGAGQFLAEAKAKGWTTLGIEISALAAEHACRQYGLEVIQKDLLSADLPGEHFDVITMWGVLEHLYSPTKALKEIYRMLKPGGLFVALVPNINSTQARIFGPRWQLLDVPRHLYHFSESTLKRMAREAGFAPAWTRYFAREQDVSQFLQTMKVILQPEGKKKWTLRRILMAVARRSALVIAKLMALRRSSATIEAYFIKPKHIS